MLKVSVDSTKLVAQLKALEAGMPRAIQDAQTAVGKMMVRTIQNNYLSGQVLKIRSGNYRNSVYASTVRSANSIELNLGATANNKGFSYPKHWEGNGRPVFSRAIAEHKQDIDKVMIDEMNAGIRRIIK